jgi:hypothetical protein
MAATPISRRFVCTLSAHHVCCKVKRFVLIQDPRLEHGSLHDKESIESLQSQTVALICDICLKTIMSRISRIWKQSGPL